MLPPDIKIMLFYLCQTKQEAQNGRRKPIATGAINMVDYVSVESRTFDITVTLKVASKKLVSASLEFNLTCVLIKEGMAT